MLVYSGYWVVTVQKGFAEIPVNRDANRIMVFWDNNWVRNPFIRALAFFKDTLFAGPLLASLSIVYDVYDCKGGFQPL